MISGVVNKIHDCEREFIAMLNRAYSVLFFVTNTKTILNILAIQTYSINGHTGHK